MTLANPKKLVMYSRTAPCPFISIAKRVLADQKVPYEELMIDQEPLYKERVLDWTGFASVPTLIIAEPSELLPYLPPAALTEGESPRGVNRGSMITEPYENELLDWLRQHQLIGG
jgi:glutaredoxin